VTGANGEPGLVVLIVDDEPLARRGLREQLARLPRRVAVLEAGSGTEAVRLIRERRPDLVLLDVQMPGMDGFAVVEAVGAPAMPPVIFVTAYDRHALRAFEVHAVDYLLKPVDPERLRDAVERARAALAADQVTALRAAVAAATRLSRTDTPPAVPDGADRRLALRDGGRIVFVRPEEIDWADADGNYVLLHVGPRAIRHRATMDEMEALLGAAFVRIRRSTLLRVGAVEYCEPWGKGSYVFVLRDRTRLTSSRYFRARLAPLFGD
jgi:two-component system LytT family response regulator